MYIPFQVHGQTEPVPRRMRATLTETEPMLFYARYERGANEMPIRYLIALCKYYNISADYILGFTNARIVLPEESSHKKITSR